MDRDSDVDIMDGEEGEYRDVEIREQDRYLPIANIARIMKKVLPNNAKIAKEAKESIQECVSEFISFITSEASDKCQQEKRKTINGDDLLWAMSTLGFDKYVDPLKVYLAKYRESVRGERPEKKTTGRKDMSAQPKMSSAPPPMTSYSFDSSVISYISNDHTTPLMAPGKTEPLPPPPIMRQSYDSHSQQSNDLPSLQLS